MTDTSGEKKSHRSVSQLTKYAKCSEEYRLTYVDKVNGPAPAAWLAQGTAFHDAVEGWENSGRSAGFDIEAEYRLVYNREIAAMRTHQPDTKKWLHGPRTDPEEDIKAREERGVLQLQKYVDFAENDSFFIKEIDDFTLAIEVPFETEIGGILVRGAIDQILILEDGVEVRDLKTGNREAGKIQLGVYKYVVEKIFKWPVKRASFFYAKDAKIVTLTEDELLRYDEEYLSSLFQSLEVGIENKVFIPNPTESCFLCSVKDWCRELGSTPRKVTL